MWKFLEKLIALRWIIYILVGFGGMIYLLLSKL